MALLAAVREMPTFPTRGARYSSADIATQSPVHVVGEVNFAGKDWAEPVETGQDLISFDASRVKDEP